jgi:hypothetical protein
MRFSGLSHLLLLLGSYDASHVVLQGLLSNARVLALGPKFMSLYICKFAVSGSPILGPYTLLQHFEQLVFSRVVEFGCEYPMCTNVIIILDSSCFSPVGNASLIRDMILCRWSAAYTMRTLKG